MGVSEGQGVQKPPRDLKLKDNIQAETRANSAAHSGQTSRCKLQHALKTMVDTWDT